jgi:hypothetical protein
MFVNGAALQRQGRKRLLLNHALAGDDPRHLQMREMRHRPNIRLHWDNKKANAVESDVV